MRETQRVITVGDPRYPITDGVEGMTGSDLDPRWLRVETIIPKRGFSIVARAKVLRVNVGNSA